ncbi:hypothetical protein [Saccharothrix saharensis]|uniref:hypothetical protein n=1 Tax=Saccharothrix saharensis TaxID=571190 RepID=UPI00114D4F76|nr:hypothetical protein [Saccharothrix saharensis]
MLPVEVELAAAVTECLLPRLERLDAEQVAAVVHAFGISSQGCAPLVEWVVASTFPLRCLT